MTVSIIIPIYNVEQYIERCINSVINQTYRQLEVILVDDCSPDNSMNLARQLVEKSTNKEGLTFKFITREKNGGLSAARNTGVEISTGDFLYFLDSDDELPVNAIDLLINQVKLYPDVEIVMGRMKSLPNSNPYYNIDRYKDTPYIDNNIWIRENFFTTVNPLPTNACNKLIRRDLIEKGLLHFRSGIIHEDQLWMYYIAKKVNRIAFVFEPTYIRYVNPGSIMTTLDYEKESKNWGVIIEEVSKSFDEPLYNQQLFRYFHEFMRLYKPERNDETYERLYCVFKSLLWNAGYFKIALYLFLYKNLYSFRFSWRIKKKIDRFILHFFKKKSI
jgi:glycosyltransferase involved in cell wall biosynthesis